MKLPVANPPLYALLNQHQAIASDIVSMREELAETQAGIDELTREGELVQKSLAVMLERVDPGHLNERAFHFTSRLRNVEWELIANPGFGRFYHHDLARMWEKRELEEFSAVARHLGLDDEYAGVLEVIRDCEYRIRKGAFYGTNDLANAKWQARKNFRNGWPIMLGVSGMAVGAFIHPWESVIGLGIVGMGIGIRKAYDHELDSVLYKNPFSEVADELEGRRHELLEMAKTYRS